MPPRSADPRAATDGNLISFLYSDQKNERRRGINSVEIGVSVLRAVIELRAPATLRSIGERAGMDSSQTHRYVSSLVNCGILKQDPHSGLYDLGPAALQVGLAAMARQDTIAVTDDAAREFSQKHEATVLVALWSSYGPTIIRWYHGNPPVYTMLGLGSVLPVTHSAIGRVFMAFLPDTLLNPMLKREGWRVPLSKNPQLVADRNAIRSAGLASANGAVVPGLRAHSAPVFGYDNNLVAVLTVAAAEATARRLDKVTKAKLLEVAQRTSGELGARTSLR